MQKIFKFILTSLLIVIPLYSKFPAIKIPGIYVAVRLEDFLILLAIIIFALPLFKNIKRILSENVSRSIALFLIIGAISVVSGIYLTKTVSPNIAILHLFRRIEYLSLFFVGYLYVINNQKADIFSYIIKVLLIVNFLVLIYALGQRFLNFPVISTQNEEYSKGVALRWISGSHINSTFAGHYDLASYIVLTLPILISSFFIYKDRISKIILGLSIVSGFWLLSVAVSRISIVAFILATSISLFVLKKYKEILAIAVISIVIFGFSADLRTRYGRIIDVLKQRISSIVVVYAQEDGNVNEDRSTSIRLNVEWPRAIRAFSKNPLLGTGYSSITLATDNDYLRALGETGILGLTSFSLIFVSLFLKFKKFIFTNSVESLFVASFIGSTVGILVTALFIDIFEASKFATMYWLFAGLVIGTINKYEQNN